MSRLGAIRLTLQRDAIAALVLGIQSVPAGLANGLLAGVNPLSGLYAYLIGPAAGALVTGVMMLVAGVHPTSSQRMASSAPRSTGGIRRRSLTSCT